MGRLFIPVWHEGNNPPPKPKKPKPVKVNFDYDKVKEIACIIAAIVLIVAIIFIKSQ